MATLSLGLRYNERAGALMNLNSLKGKTVLITGVSTGIGLALLKSLWNSPLRVVGTARLHSLTRLNLANFPEREGALLLPLDVTNAEERKQVIDQIQKRFGGVDILINNAGVAYRSVIEDLTEEELKDQLAVNTIGPLELIRLVLPHMRKNRWGKIINVSSVGGMMAMPTMGPYSASKFALEGASEALWYEMRPWNISVSIIQPGFINSSGFRHTKWSKQAAESYKGSGPYHLYYKYMSSFIERMMGHSADTSVSVSRKILKTIKQDHPPLRVPVTLDAHFFSWFRRFVPRWLYHAVLYRSLPSISKWGGEEIVEQPSRPLLEEVPVEDRKIKSA